MHKARTQIIGILNVTRDSFSDGGRWLAPEDALARAWELAAAADVIDIGAESTHPDAEDVSAEEEIRRLAPVVTALRAQGGGRGVRISVDCYKPEVIAAMLELGVDMINDVTGVADRSAARLLAGSDVDVIVMHNRSPRARAEHAPAAAGEMVAAVIGFFRARVAQLEEAGVAPQRLILDPGMGLFLSADPADSIAVLRAVPRIATLDGWRPGQRWRVCVSTSRKSFIGALLGPRGGPPRQVEARGAGTLATELYAAARGVDFIRTHDAQALRDALTLWAHLAVESADG